MTREGRSSFYKVEPMEFESESVMVHYVRRESERVLDFLKFLLFLMSLPFVMILMFLVLLMAVFAILVMSVRDWVVEQIRSCWEVFFRVPKKVGQIEKDRSMATRSYLKNIGVLLQGTQKVMIKMLKGIIKLYHIKGKSIDYSQILKMEFVAFSYVGANNLSEYHCKVEFVRVTRWNDRS